MTCKKATEWTDRNGRRFRVRRVCRGDADTLRTFHDALGADRALFMPHSYDPTTLEKLLLRSEQGRDLVLGLFEQGSEKAEGRMVGYFFLWYFDERVPLLGIGLLACCRGAGLASQAIQLLLRQAERAGCEAVGLTTLPDNHRAFALYEKCGFRWYADVKNLDGNGRIVIERAMLYEIKPGARPMDRPHAPPVAK